MSPKLFTSKHVSVSKKQLAEPHKYIIAYKKTPTGFTNVRSFPREKLILVFKLTDKKPEESEPQIEEVPEESEPKSIEALLQEQETQPTLQYNFTPFSPPQFGQVQPNSNMCGVVPDRSLVSQNS